MISLWQEILKEILNRLATNQFEQAVVEKLPGVGILGLGMIDELKQISVAFFVHFERVTEVLPVIFKGRLQYRLVFNSSVFTQHLLAHSGVCSRQNESIGEAAQEIQSDLAVLGVLQP